ncbi:hypothetical protein ACFLTB_04920 [Chloroflexota bacterium]
MEPKPEHCLICGREVTAGIDTHVIHKHGLEYSIYRKYFYDCLGSYGVYEKGGKTILTITREVKPEY